MSDDTKEKWKPYFDEAEAESILGKTLLVGVTHRDKNDQVMRYEQFHGEIVRASRQEGIILRIAGTGQERWVPPDLSRLEPAEPGEYHLKSTGEVVVDPDFISTWSVYPRS